MSTRRSKKKGAEHLAKELKVSRLLDDTNDIILDECLKETVTIFGGIKSFLHFVATNANQNQLESIKSMICKKKQQHEDIGDDTEMNDNEEEEEEEEEEDESKPCLSPFISLPIECICHISGYLDKRNIKQFKLTSRQIATICLQEMNKINAGIFDMNSLLINDNNKSNLYGFKFVDHIKWIRHNAKKSYYVLFEEWEKQYNIPEKYQLLTYSQSMQTVNIDKMRLKTIEFMKYQWKFSYLLFDKRKIIILDSNTQRKCETFTPKHNHNRLFILEYFDIFNQKMNVIQFLFGDKQNITFNRILQYIQCGFIPTESYHNEWYEELKKTLNIMPDDAKHEKLCLYQYVEHKSSAISLIDGKQCKQSISFKPCSKFVFQINFQHKWFKNTDKLDKIKTLCNQQMIKLHEKATLFCKHNENARINMHCLNDIEILKKCIIKKYGQHKNIEGIINGLRTMYFSKSSFSALLRTKIANILQNVFDPKNIELIRNGKRVKFNDCISQNTTISYKMVLYDVKNYESTKDILYTINIFKPFNCPHPFHYGDKDMISLIIPYKTKFKYNEFINHIFDIIKNSENHILYNEYKELLNLKRNDCISCIITKSIRRGWNHGNMNNEHINVYKYSLNGQFVKHKTFKGVNPVFDLFMNRMDIDESSNDFKLEIKFVSEKTKLSTKTDVDTVYDIRYVGLPFIVGINKDDSLQYILNTYLKEVIPFIVCCYVIKMDDKIVTIPQSKRSEYKPYYEIVEHNSDNFIILKVKSCRKSNAYLPIYG